MSDQPQEQPKLLVEPTAKDAIIQHNGTEVRIRYKPITRAMRNRALQEAAAKWRRDHPDEPEGVDVVELEYQLALQSIQTWSLGKSIKLGWDLLPADSNLGDRIAEAVGIADAMKAMVDQRNGHSEAASNLSSGGEPAPAV